MSLFLLAAAIACAPHHAPQGDTASLAIVGFDGIASATWDGGDGLIAAWTAAEGDVSYLASLATLDGEVLATVETETLEAAFSGLGDGEYALWVEAISGEARAGGEVTLRQYVGSNRLVYRSELALPGAMDVWGEGDVVALAGGLNPQIDVLLADISDPAAPFTLATIEGLDHVRDVKMGDGHLFVAEDCQCDLDSLDGWHSEGVKIYDLADPTQPEPIATLGDPARSIHNLTWAEGILYLSDDLEQRVLIYDVADPAAPSLLSEIRPEQHGVHDQTWQDGVLYVAGGGGFAAWDVTDPAAPVEIWTQTADTQPGYHNIAPTADGDYVLTSEEVVDGAMRIWDVSDPSAIQEIASWQTDPGQCVHNVYAAPGHALTSWYTDGALAFDLSDPAAPVQVGAYDTYSGEEGPIETLDGTDEVPRIQGAWGLWHRDGLVAVGDTERGLILLELFPVTATVSGD